jgi:DNA (cytosine-5)-methyltransferase 1
MYHRNFTFIDVFAGCGGLSLGLMQAGWKGLFAVERDTNAFQTLEANLLSKSGRFRFDWPSWLPQRATGVAELLEAHKTDLKSMSGKVDMLVGGPPCQGFSSAGKRNPADPRNRLVEHYLEFVRILRPKVVLIENVRGIAADFNDDASVSGKTNYAQWIIAELARDYDVTSQIIDTSDYGVPQKRHRFLIVALRKGTGLENANPFEIVDELRPTFLRKKGFSSVPVSTKAAISDLEVKANGTNVSQDTAGFAEISYSRPSSSYQKVMNLGHEGRLSDTRLARHRPEISARFQKIIDLCHTEGRLNVSLSSELRASFGLKKCAIRVLDPDKPSPTITSMPDDLIHYSEPRTLTVRENARLQSFPDWFEFKGKYTTGGERRRREVPRFTQVANAVPPLVAEAFGIALRDVLASNAKSPSILKRPEYSKASLGILEAQL